MSRSPEWLVPLLYEHLLMSLSRANAQMQAGDIEGKGDSLQKASTIVTELLGSLDHEKGGPIATQLSALYAYFTVEILDISRTQDQVVLARLIAMIAELHTAWVEAAEQIAPRSSGAVAKRQILQLA